MAKTVEEKCAAIVRAIVKVANSEGSITFAEDLGYNSLTVGTPSGHTHCGMMSDGKPTEEEFARLVDSLYRTLSGGPGLSWFSKPPKAVAAE